MDSSVKSDQHSQDQEQHSDGDSDSFEDALEQLALQCEKEQESKSAEDKDQSLGVPSPSDESTLEGVSESAPNLAEKGVGSALNQAEENPGGGEEEEEEEEENEEKDDEEIDEVTLKDRDAGLSPEELEELHKESLQVKLDANAAFKSGQYDEAISKYTLALLTCPLCHSKDRSVLYSNRAAAHMRLEHNEKCIRDCTKAVELNPQYVKALLRRAEVYERTEKLDEALADYQKLVELDPSLVAARQACMRLPDQINERNEKLKTEMIGKLKDLGNLVLRPFGLSTDNFNLQQDPNTGGYSVQFQQKPTNGK